MPMKFRLICSNRTKTWFSFLIISIIMVVISHMFLDKPDILTFISNYDLCIVTHFLMGVGIGCFLRFYSLELYYYFKTKKIMRNISVTKKFSSAKELSDYLEKEYNAKVVEVTKK